MNNRTRLGAAFVIVCVVGIATSAMAKTVLNVGYQKVGHLAPLILAADAVRRTGVDLRLVELLRYSDARPGLSNGALDLASAGPVELASTVASGSSQIVALMGTGSSPKYVVGRNGAKLDAWQDIRGKKIAIAPGSASWLQFAAMLKENDIAYNSFDAVNIQSGGASFDNALEQGDIDAIVTWEPYESRPVSRGYGFAALNLDYSLSHAVGAGLGMLLANKAVVATKRGAIQAFVSAYVVAMRDYSDSVMRFADGIMAVTGIEPVVAERMARVIKLTPELDEHQIVRQARMIYDLGLVARDPSSAIGDALDLSFLREAMK